MTLPFMVFVKIAKNKNIIPIEYIFIKCYFIKVRKGDIAHGKLHLHCVSLCL